MVEASTEKIFTSSLVERGTDNAVCQHHWVTAVHG